MNTQIAETDLAAQARITAAQVAKGAQMGAKGAAEGFNRFVEGESSNKRSVPIDESKKDFWDSFSEAGAQREASRPSAVGTSAIKKPATPMGPKGDEDQWEKW